MARYETARARALAGEYASDPEPAFNWDHDVPYANVSEGDDKFASKMRANLARSKWADYKTRFQPYEDDLAAQAYVGPEGEWMEGTPMSVKMRSADIDGSSPLGLAGSVMGAMNGEPQGPEGGMVGQAERQARSQFDTGLEVAGRQRQRYGMSGPGESTQRRNKLAKGLSVVGARNNAHDDWEEQRMGLLTGMGGQ